MLTLNVCVCKSVTAFLTCLCGCVRSPTSLLFRRPARSVISAVFDESDRRETPGAKRSRDDLAEISFILSLTGESFMWRDNRNKEQNWKFL